MAVWYALTALPPLFLAWRMWGSGGVAGIDARLYTIVAACFSVASGLQYGTGNAVLMSLSSRAVAATQFTGYMALKNLALTYSNLWQGRMASTHGYARTLLIDGIGAVAPILGPAVPAPAPAPGRRAGSGGRPHPHRMKRAPRASRISPSTVPEAYAAGSPASAASGPGRA